MDYVDEFCKLNYDNNRKVMILDLIRYKEENMATILLNEKINVIYKELSNRIDDLTPKKEVKEKKKVAWKGFGGQ